MLTPFVNLVKPTCQTVTAGSVDLSGDFTGITKPTTLTGDLTIPKFTSCGLLSTPFVTAAVSGPGNKVTVQLAPPAS